MQRQRHVFQAIQRREQVEKLKYESDFIAPNARQIVVGEVSQIFALDPNFSRRRPVQASHQIEKSGFTRSGGTNDRDDLPFRNIQIDIMERRGFALSIKDLRNVIQSNHKYRY